MIDASRTSRRVVVLAAIAAIGATALLGKAATAQRATIPRPPGTEYEGQAFTFHQIREDIYHAIGTGELVVGCNATVIINEADVLVVDTHISPAAGWALVEEIKTLTPKPVRYVVNTHFHFDHAHGNQVFPAGVEIIGHEFTREMLATGRSTSGRTHDLFVAGLPDRIAAMRERAADMVEMNEREELEREIAIQERYLASSNAVEPTPPTVTLERAMTIHRGGREIQLLHLGRGHTGGDVVVFLPQERIVVTGDLMTAGLAYMGDSYPEDWIETLERLKALDFDTVVPGHGRAFDDTARIDRFQAYLEDFWSQVTALHGQGVDAAEAARRIDMRAHATSFPGIEEAGMSPQAVDRAYGLLNGTEE